jgi:CheY-like chemotaxis protein
MSTATGFRLLLIEPCDDFRIVMIMLLELAGCELRSADSSSVALHVAREFAPHIILTELTVAGGIDIARQLKAMPEVQNTSIVALTSLYWPGIELEAATAGFAHYFLKPVAFDPLIKVIASLATLHGEEVQLLD